MKVSIILIAFVSILFLSCGGKKTETDISGIFVNQAKSEYSIAYDTLIITPVNGVSNRFQIEDRAGYQKIRAGKLLPFEFKQQNWQATWDSEKQLLSEGEMGRQIQYDNQKKSILIKNTEYRRVK
jgi:hypothetical protein